MSIISPATTTLRPPATPTLSTLMSAVTSCRCCVAKHDLAFSPSLHSPFGHPTQDKAGGARLEKDLKLYTRLIDLKLKQSPLDMRQRVYLSKLCPGHLAVLMGLPPHTPTSSSPSTTSCAVSLSSSVVYSPKPRTSSVPGLEHSLQGESAAIAAAAAAAAAGPALAAASANDNKEDAVLLVASGNAQQQAGEGEEERQQEHQQQETSGPTAEAAEGGEGEEEEAAGEALPVPAAPPAVEGAAEAKHESTQESVRVSVPGGWESEGSLWKNVCSTFKGVVDLTVLLAQAFSQATYAALGHISCLFAWV